MPQVTGLGHTWNLPNYAGELFTADPTQTPLLSMIGGLTGGKQTDNFEFPTALLFDYPAAAQPAISEQASATAPTASHAARTQELNVVQIHQETIDLTYAKQSNRGRLNGINTAGAQANPSDEKAWQVQHKLTKIARDVEFSFIKGTYAKATSESTPNKTRGLLELCTSSSSTSIDASTAALTREMLDELYRSMADKGAYFNNMVMFCGTRQKQAVSAVYEKQFIGSLPASRNIAGINVTEIETDFLKMGVIWSRFMPTDAILIVDVSHLAPVFQVVPGKGVLFEEDLAKVGASDRIQIYGQIGLAHGPAFLHGAITNLKTN